MQTVFIIGANGFIGSHVVDWYRDRGHAVRCLVRSPERATHLHRDGVQIVPGTLQHVDGWRPQLDGCDAVIHAGGLVAARRHRELFHVNGDAVGSLADACAARETPPVLVPPPPLMVNQSMALVVWADVAHSPAKTNPTAKAMPASIRSARVFIKSVKHKRNRRATTVIGPFD